MKQSTTKARDPDPSTRGRVGTQALVGTVSVTRASHSPGQTLPLHAHPGWSAVLVFQGSFREEHDRRCWCCRRDDVLLRPAHAPHANRFGGSGAAYMVVKIPDEILSLFGGRGALFEDVRVFRDPGTRRLMQGISRSALRPDRDTPAELEDLLLRLLGTALGCDGACAGGPIYGGQPPAWLREVYDRVHEAFRDRPSTAELAADAGVHPDHVCRAFRRTYGFTISDLVRRRRVEHAVESIRSGAELSRVAYDAGFSDQSHMTRQMRRYLGLTPSELQRR